MKDVPIPEFMREVTGIWKFTTAPLNGQVFVSQDEQPRCIVMIGTGYFFVKGSWEYKYLYTPEYRDSYTSAEMLLVDGELLYWRYGEDVHIENGTPCYFETLESEPEVGYGGEYISPTTYTSHECSKSSHYSKKREYYYGDESIDKRRWDELHCKQPNRIVHLSHNDGEFLVLLTKETVVVASLASGQCMELEPRYKNIVHVCSHIHDRIQFYVLDGLRLFRVVYTPS